MAILQQSCLEFIRNELNTQIPEYSNYAYIAPEEAAFPFLTVSALSSISNFTFGSNLETIRIQISFFDNNPSAEGSGIVMDRLTTIFHNKQLIIPVPDKGCSIKLVCSHKSNE